MSLACGREYSKQVFRVVGDAVSRRSSCLERGLSRGEGEPPARPCLSFTAGFGAKPPASFPFYSRICERFFFSRSVG